jgi:uncharacterized protein YggE
MNVLRALSRLEIVPKQRSLPVMKSLCLAASCCLVFASAAWADVGVTGTGTVKYKPNKASIVVEFTSEGKTKAEARAKYNEDRKGICAELEKHGFRAKQIKASRLTINPKYVYPKGEPARLVGYLASGTLSWTTEDLTKLTAMLDDVESSNYEVRIRVRFSSTEIEKLLDEARKRAVADARRKAELFASSADTKLGKVKSLTEQSTFAPSLGEFTYTKTGGPATTAPEELSVSVQVGVIYESA